MAIEYRKYNNYDEYVNHQSSKLRTNIEQFKKSFKQRYKTIYFRVEKLVSNMDKGKVLCLGARLGEEVKAFIALGFDKAVGIDLYPGENNPLVIKGDFHNINFGDKSFDIVYTNCLDHASDLNKIISECKRVLNDNGNVILEISKSVRLTTKWKDKNKQKQIESSKYYESMIWDSIDDVVNEFKENGFEEISRVSNDLNYLGVVLRKK